MGASSIFSGAAWVLQRRLGGCWGRLGNVLGLLGYLGRLGSVIASPGAVEGAGKEAGGAMPAGGRLTVGNACLACRSAGFGPRPFGATRYPIFLGFPKLPSHETEQRAISFQGEARRRGRGRSTASKGSNRKVIWPISPGTSSQLRAPRCGSRSVAARFA